MPHPVNKRLTNPVTLLLCNSKLKTGENRMYMINCLVSLHRKNYGMREVYCNPNSNIPMPFATVEDAHKFAENKLLNKKFENIGNKNSVVAFQIVNYNPKPKTSAWTA